MPKCLQPPLTSVASVNLAGVVSLGGVPQSKKPLKLEVNITSKLPSSPQTQGALVGLFLLIACINMKEYKQLWPNTKLLSEMLALS